jgi:hypothetical protein
MYNLYFIENKKLSARKIGITGRPLSLRYFQDWKLIHQVQHENIHVIRICEKKILQILRQKYRLKVKLDKAQLGFGYTETFDIKGRPSNRKIARLMNSLVCEVSASVRDL